MALTSSRNLALRNPVSSRRKRDGEVIARDVRLVREVGIEVLPETLVKDADRLCGSEPEAERLRLSIIRIFWKSTDIGTHKGARFPVSELLEGQPREKFEASDTRSASCGTSGSRL